MRGRWKPCPHDPLAQERETPVTGTIHSCLSMKRHIERPSAAACAFPSFEQSYDDAVRIETEDSPQGVLGLGFTRSRLFIDCFQPQDEGTYTCVADNAFERLSSSSLIEVTPSSRSLIESNDITLCTSKKSEYGMSEIFAHLAHGNTAIRLIPGSCDFLSPTADACAIQDLVRESICGRRQDWNS